MAVMKGTMCAHGFAPISATGLLLFGDVTGYGGFIQQAEIAITFFFQSAIVRPSMI